MILVSFAEEEDMTFQYPQASVTKKSFTNLRIFYQNVLVAVVITGRVHETVRTNSLRQTITENLQRD